MKKVVPLVVLLVLIATAPFAVAGDERGIWIKDTPCAEDEVLAPSYYRTWEDGQGADAWYVCRQAEDYAITLIREVEAAHDSVTCFVVAKRPRHWYRHHGLKLVASEMCHH